MWYVHKCDFIQEQTPSISHSVKIGRIYSFSEASILKREEMDMKQQKLHTKCFEDELNEFENRFSDFRAQKRTLSFVSDPWHIL